MIALAISLAFLAAPRAAGEDVAKACATEMSLFCGGKSKAARRCLAPYLDALLPDCRRALGLPERRKRRASYQAAAADTSFYPDVVEVTQPDPDLAVTQRPVYYYVRGATGDEVWRNLLAVAPTANGKTQNWGRAVSEHGLAITGVCYSNNTWKFEYDRALKLENGEYRETSCAVKTVHVDLSIIVSLPRWEAPVDAAPGLFERFRRYFNHIKVHEYGHRDISIEQWKSFVAQARSLPAAPTCAELNQSISALSDRLSKDADKRNEDHDEATRLGRTQNGWDNSF